MRYTEGQLWALVALRVLVGWHLMYEGLAKLLNPYWTSAGYLTASEGPFSWLFVWLASDPGMLRAVDLLNVWGLILIGLALMLGLLARPAAIAGVLLLALYYLSSPPWIGLESPLPAEGSYLFVDRTLIELAALVVLLWFPTSDVVGLDRLVRGTREEAAHAG